MQMNTLKQRGALYYWFYEELPDVEFLEEQMKSLYQRCVRESKK